MPVLDITKPEVIQFLIESYDKTTRLRMKWNEVHAAGLKKAATLQREERGYYETDVLKAAMVAGMPTVIRDHKVSERNRRVTPVRDGTHIPGVAHLRKGHSIPEVELGDLKDDPRLGRPDTDLSSDPLMRPMDQKQRKILYKNFPVFGRKVYLKSRVQIPPEKRYYFSECSGWKYGWRLNDSYFNNNAPKYGRVWRLTRDVMSLTGPQPDPHYYKNSKIPGPSKCLEI